MEAGVERCGKGELRLYADVSGQGSKIAAESEMTGDKRTERHGSDKGKIKL